MTRTNMERPWEKYIGLRSGLVVAGFDEARLAEACGSNSDIVVIELDDGVPQNRKAEARSVVLHALRELDWAGKLSFVKINPITSEYLEKDLEVVIEGKPFALLLPKCHGPEEISKLDEIVAKLERERKLPDGSTRFGAMIDSIKGFSRVEEIAAASTRMVALFIEPDNLAAEIGFQRTAVGHEPQLLWYQSRVVCAAHASGILAIDSPSLPHQNSSQAYEQVRWSYLAGFDAKVCNSLEEVEVTNRAFAPTDDEIKWAKDVMQGREEAEASGQSVWVKQDMMIDDAHVARARSILFAVQKNTQ